MEGVAIFVGQLRVAVPVPMVGFNLASRVGASDRALTLFKRCVIIRR